MKKVVKNMPSAIVIISALRIKFLETVIKYWPRYHQDILNKIHTALNITLKLCDFYTIINDL